MLVLALATATVSLSGVDSVFFLLLCNLVGIFGGFSDDQLDIFGLDLCEEVIEVIEVEVELELRLLLHEAVRLVLEALIMAFQFFGEASVAFEGILLPITSVRIGVVLIEATVAFACLGFLPESELGLLVGLEAAHLHAREVFVGVLEPVFGFGLGGVAPLRLAVMRLHDVVK